MPPILKFAAVTALAASMSACGLVRGFTGPEFVISGHVIPEPKEYSEATSSLYATAIETHCLIPPPERDTTEWAMCKMVEELGTLRLRNQCARIGLGLTSSSPPSLQRRCSPLGS